MRYGPNTSLLDMTRNRLTREKTHQNTLSSGERVSKNFENMTSDSIVLPAFTTVSITPPVVQNLEKN
jgi:hypothetical protein